MLELTVLARRDTRMGAFLRDVQQRRVRRPVRLVLEPDPSRTIASAPTGVVRWLIVDEHDLTKPRTKVLVRRLFSSGAARIGVRRSARSMQHALTVPPVLGTLATRGVKLMMFQFGSHQFDLVKQALGIAPRLRLAAARSDTASAAASDSLYLRAVALSTAHERVSLSLIQRSLGISYSRARSLADAIADARHLDKSAQPPARRCS